MAQLNLLDPIIVTSPTWAGAALYWAWVPWSAAAAQRAAVVAERPRTTVSESGLAVLGDGHP